LAGFLKSILFPSENEKKQKEIRVGIAELAPIWLRYNQSFAPQEVSKIEGTQESESLPVRPRSRPRAGQAGTRTEETHPEPAQMSFFSQEVLREFFEPYRSLFESQGARDGFISLLEFLDRYGSSPSIVMIKNDSEADELYSVSGILQKVTLREHSLNAARIMLKLIRETYKDYENLIPRALVVSLGHDIGKAPLLRESGLYAKADHPIISAQKVGEVFSGREPLWLQSAIETIKEHHGPTRNPFTLLLMKADSKAREMEIAALSKELKVKEWNEWFDVKRFLEILLPEINLIKTGNKWNAFSYSSLVYFQPDFLYECAKRLATEKKVIDLILLKVSNKQEAIKKVVESLRQARILSSDLGETKWGRSYEIQSERFCKKMFLIPVKIDAFGVLPHEIERRKEGYLETIERVVPAGK
jgi:hypothetical protein